MTTLQGKTCLVTGGTEGVGFATAGRLAAQGATVILVARDADRGAARAATIRRRCGHERVSFVAADLSATAEVAALARHIAAAHDQLDVLVNNAGGLFTGRRESADGLKYTFALNHLAYFQLTRDLLDMLKAAPAARVVNVASGVHRGVSIDFNDLQGTRHYDGWLAYRRSKLMNVMFTYALARRLDVNSIAANALHPGFVRSQFGHNNGVLVATGLRIAQLIGGVSAEQGARTAIHLAASPAVDSVSGEYFEACKSTPSSPESRVVADQERLWQASEDLLAALTRDARDALP